MFGYRTDNVNQLRLWVIITNKGVSVRISTTERQTKERCLRKWDLSSYNRQALVPVVNAVPLDFGTIWHATLAAWTKDPDLDPHEIYTQIFGNHLSLIIRNYEERIGCKPSREELSPLLTAIELGSNMLTNYKEHWHSPLPPGFTLIENELTLIQDIPNTRHCTRDYPCSCQACTDGPIEGLSECNCPIEMHQLECTFDGVMADANGDLFIIERKTYARTPNLEEINYNDQFLAYMWALDHKLPNVVGVAYDGALKSIKKPLDESFLRRILLRSRDELQSFEEHLTYQALDMARLNAFPYNHPALYPVVPPIVGCMRWECAWIDVCHAMEKRRDTSELLKMYTRSNYKRHLDED